MSVALCSAGPVVALFSLYLVGHAVYVFTSKNATGIDIIFVPNRDGDHVKLQSPPRARGQPPSVYSATTDFSSIVFFDLKSDIFYLFKMFTIPTWWELICDSVVRSKNSVTRSKNFLDRRQYHEVEVKNLFEGKITPIWGRKSNWTEICSIVS